MSTERHLRGAGYTPPRRDSEGRALCRWCAKPVTGRRRTFCSAECVHEWQLRSSSQYVRSHLARRDHGICAECGRDCIATRQAYRDFTHALTGHSAWWTERPIRPVQYDWLAFHAIPRGRALSDYWDADHITPVVEGGGLCGLDNYRTLCIPCHRIATASLAAKRAHQREVRRLNAMLGNDLFAPDAAEQDSA